SSTSVAQRRSSRARSPGATRRHVSNAPLERSIAASVSSSDVAGTVWNTAPVAGLTSSVISVMAANSETLTVPSETFKATEQLPIRHRGVERRQLDTGHVGVVRNHVVTERGP